MAFISRWLPGVLLAATVGTASLGAAASDTEQSQGTTLSGDEIRNQIWGHRVQGTMTDGQRYDETYGSDGAIEGDGYTGQASVQGDRMCFDYGGNEPACYGVRRDEQRIQWLDDKEVVGEGIISETQ